MSFAETATCPIHDLEPLQEHVYGVWEDDDSAAGSLVRVWFCPTLAAEVRENDVVWMDVVAIIRAKEAQKARESALRRDVRWCDICGGSRPGWWEKEQSQFRCEPCGTLVQVVHDISAKAEGGDVA